MARTSGRSDRLTTRTHESRHPRPTLEWLPFLVDQHLIRITEWWHILVDVSSSTSILIALALVCHRMRRRAAAAAALVDQLQLLRRLRLLWLVCQLFGLWLRLRLRLLALWLRLLRLLWLSMMLYWLLHAVSLMLHPHSTIGKELCALDASAIRELVHLVLSRADAQMADKVANEKGRRKKAAS